MKFTLVRPRIVGTWERDLVFETLLVMRLKDA
jgi:hypothetical protein